MNLIAKATKFKNLLEIMDNDIVLAVKIIENIKNEKLKDNLINEAKEYMANLYQCSKDEVYFGDIDNNYWGKEFPFVIVVGDVNLDNYNYVWRDEDMSKLKRVYGHLRVRYVEEFPNLELVAGSVYGANSRVKRLPKLRYAEYVKLGGSQIEELGIIKTREADLRSTKNLNTLKIKEVESLNISRSNIKDISALEKCNSLVCEDINIESFNPNLKIKMLICHNANNFENKINLENVVILYKY